MQQDEPAVIEAFLEASHEPEVIEALLVEEHFDISQDPEALLAPVVVHLDMSHVPLVKAACFEASHVPDVIEAFLPAVHDALHEEPAAAVAPVIGHAAPLVIVALVVDAHFVTSQEPAAC